MLTQAIPALVKALSGNTDPATLQQIAQALGNCSQPLTHRGDINVQPNGPANDKGVIRPGAWNPNDPQYSGLIPPAGSGGMFDIPGWSGSNWNTNNYGGDQFSFPTNQEFINTNYFGGPTNNYGGNSYFDNSTHNNITVNNINTTTINNQPVAPGGPTTPGPAGPPGIPGPQGAPGEPGVVFVVPFNLPTFQLSYLSGANPRVNAEERELRVVVGGNFNPDTCQIDFAFKRIKYVESANLAGVVRQTARVVGNAGQ